MKYTNYYNSLIETYDDFLPFDEYSDLYSEVEKLPFYYGEKDGPGYKPSGLVSDLNDSEIHNYLYEKVKDLDSLKGLMHKRTYVNYFGMLENAGYHNDDTAKTLLFYFNQEWDANDAGETKFLIDAKDVPGIRCENTEDYPIIVLVAPISNRIVIFQGDMIHTASSFRDKERFTLAMKFESKD